jgi:hypothetical protein
MKIHSVVAEVFHVDRQTDRHKETVAFRNFFLPTEYQIGLHMRFGRGSERKKDPIIHVIANRIDFIWRGTLYVERNLLSYFYSFFLPFFLILTSSTYSV